MLRPLSRGLSAWVFCLLLVFSIWQSSVHAAENPYECLHSWATKKGAIGSTRVTLSFDVGRLMDFEQTGTAQDSAPLGRYYYRDKWEDLLLVPDRNVPFQWDEVDPRGRITGRLFLECHATTVTGVWRSADGARSVPIELRDADGDRYFAGKIQQASPVSVAPQGRHDDRYHEIALPWVKRLTTYHLKGKSAGIRRINDALWNDLLSNADEAQKCTVANRWHQAPGESPLYYYDTYNTILATNRKYVVTSLGAQFNCLGNPHPYSNSRVMVFDLESGEIEDMKSWFAQPYQDASKSDNRLWHLIMVRYFAKRGDEEDQIACSEHVDFDVARAYPNANGMSVQVASNWHGTGNCNEEVSVPFDKILPFLSEKGRRNIRYFRAK